MNSHLFLLSSLSALHGCLLYWNVWMPFLLHCFAINMLECQINFCSKTLTSTAWVLQGKHEVTGFFCCGKLNDTFFINLNHSALLVICTQNEDIVSQTSINWTSVSAWANRPKFSPYFSQWNSASLLSRIHKRQILTRDIFIFLHFFMKTAQDEFLSFTEEYVCRVEV